MSRREALLEQAWDELQTAIRLLHGGDLAGAELHCMKSVDLAAQSGAARPVADSLAVLGEIGISAGRWDKAERCFLESSVLYMKLHAREIAGRCLLRLAHVYSQANDHEGVVTAYSRAAELFQDERSRDDLLTSLDGLEKGYVLLGRLEAAEKVVSSLFQLHREAGDPLEQGRCLVRLAALYSGTGRYSEAIVASRTSVGFFFKAHDYESASLALTQLGLDYAFAGHMDKAEDSLQDAASTAREINEGPVTARLWAAFGFLYQWTSQFSEARSYLVQAVELLLRLGQEAQARACLAVLAAVCQRSGELDEAESIYADLVDEAQSVEDLESLGCSLRGLIQIGAAKSEMAESKSWLHHPTMDRIAATDPALYAEIHLDYAKEVLTCSRIPGLVSEEDIQDAARGALSGLVYLDSTGLVFRSRDTRAALASRISSYRNLVSEILDRVGDPRLMAEWIELSFSLIKPGHMPQEPRVGAGPEAWMLNRLDPAGSAAGPTIGAVLQHVARAGSHRLLTGTGLPAGPGPLLLSPGVHNGPHCHFALSRHIDAVPYPARARPVPILAW